MANNHSTNFSAILIDVKQSHNLIATIMVIAKVIAAIPGNHFLIAE
jgi:hypothetical protein